ncbi:hypothetical protein P4B35_08875 [Pontiellaceae bacterium B12227]|nr:hypothetical protein [Pontiellaceae bacterium B12227]
MKNQIRTVVAMIAALGLGSGVNAEKILVDFGNDGAYRSLSVSEPDENGNYWNEVGAGADPSNMVTTVNSASTIHLLRVNGHGTDSFNGPAGATSADTNSPNYFVSKVTNSTFNAVALGDLGVTNAIFDYFSASSGTNFTFKLAGLDPAKIYSLKFFGSHKYPGGESGGVDETRTTRYAVTGGEGLQTSDLVVGVFAAHNESAAASVIATPDVNDEIIVAVSGLTSTNSGYINAMSIEILDTPPPVPSKIETVLIDLGSDATYRSLSVDSPDANGNFWNVIGYGYVANMLDINGDATTIDFGPGAHGRDSYNGPAGATSTATLETDVLNTDIDAYALGALGINEAAFDYFVGTNGSSRGRFQIQGLDPSKKYNLTFYGSHKFDTPGSTTYAVYTDSGYSNLVDSVTLAHNNEPINGQEFVHNKDRLATIAQIAPQASNILYVEFGGPGGANGYLNAMRIDVIPDPVNLLGGWFDTTAEGTQSASGADLIIDLASGGASYVSDYNCIDKFYGSDTNEDYLTGPYDVGTSAISLQSNQYVLVTITNEALDSISLEELRFDWGARFAGSPRYFYLEYEGGDLSGVAPGTTLWSITSFAESPTLDGSITNFHDTDVDLTGLADNTLSLGQSATFKIRVDEFGDAGRSLIDNIGFFGSGGSPYFAWSFEYGLTEGEYGDDDNDGQLNIYEFGFGGNPTNGFVDGNLPEYGTMEVGGTNMFEYVYARRTGNSGLNYYLEVNNNLVYGTWTNGGYTEVAETGIIDADFESVTNLVPATEDSKFVRMTIENQ